MIKILLIFRVALREELSQNQNDCQANEILKTMMRETRKEAPQYRCHALVALGDTLLALKVDSFEEVYSMLMPILKKVKIISSNPSINPKQR
jgi:hypothetical protein